MKQKDLAEEYAIKAKENAIYFKDGNFPNMPLYQENDIKAAFNAGRESVVGNMPELEWKDEDRRGDEENYIEESYSLTPFGDYSILRWYTPTDITIYFNGEHFKSGITSVQQAKQAANEDYKKRIKQALGL